MNQIVFDTTTIQVILWTGQVPQPSQTRSQVIDNVGVNGYGIRRVGVKARPFVLQSICDYTNLISARAALAVYLSIVNQGDCTLTWRNQIISPITVLAVEPVEFLQSTCVVGGINVLAGLPATIMRVNWQLLQRV